MLCVAVAMVTVLAGCGRAEGVAPVPTLSLTPPTPAGLEELPPELVAPPENTDADCDVTASLRTAPQACGRSTTWPTPTGRSRTSGRGDG